MSLLSYVESENAHGLAEALPSASKKEAHEAFLAVVAGGKVGLVDAFVTVTSLHDAEWDEAIELAGQSKNKAMSDALMVGDTLRVQNEVKTAAAVSGPSVEIIRKLDILSIKDDKRGCDPQERELRKRILGDRRRGDRILALDEPIPGVSNAEVRRAFAAAVTYNDPAIITALTYHKALGVEDFANAAKRAQDKDLVRALNMATFERSRYDFMGKYLEAHGSEPRVRQIENEQEPVAAASQEPAFDVPVAEATEWTEIVAAAVKKAQGARTDSEAYHGIADACKQLDLLAASKKMHPERFIPPTQWKDGIQDIRNALVSKLLVRGAAQQHLNYLSNKYYFRP